MSNGMTAREHVEAIHICKDEYHEVLEKRVLARKNPTWLPLHSRYSLYSGEQNELCARISISSWALWPCIGRLLNHKSSNWWITEDMDVALVASVSILCFIFLNNSSTSISSDWRSSANQPNNLFIFRNDLFAYKQTLNIHQKNQKNMQAYQLQPFLTSCNHLHPMSQLQIWCLATLEVQKLEQLGLKGPLSIPARQYIFCQDQESERHCCVPHQRLVSLYGRRQYSPLELTLGVRPKVHNMISEPSLYQFMAYRCWGPH